MEIMPPDREQKWQRVFRRFGLPGEAPEQDANLQTPPKKTKAPAAEVDKPKREKQSR